MWLVGVVVRRYIDFLIILIPIYSTCISSFLQQHPYIFVHFKHIFSFLKNSHIYGHMHANKSTANLVGKISYSKSELEDDIHA